MIETIHIAANTIDFIEKLLGINDLWSFLIYVFWASIGVLLCLLLNAAKRDLPEHRSPTKFSWKFLIYDNIRRLTIAFILILVSLRFSKEIFGLEQNAFTAFIIGFSSDSLARVIQNKKMLKFDNKI